MDGTIDAICSDHTPVDDDCKLLPFAESDAGATCLELLLPLSLKWAAEQKLSISDAIARISSTPASILGIPAGRLSIGDAADLVIFDPESHWKVERSKLHSQGKNTPFLNMEMVGQVRYTLINGQLRFEN
jgi:dihydroorotase